MPFFTLLLANGSLVDQSTNRSIWSGVESCIAIVCANLATLRPVLNYLFTGKHPSKVKSGSTSRLSANGTGTKSWRIWTWWQATMPRHQPGKANKDGIFHRLEQYPEAKGTNDAERLDFESAMMSPASAPNLPGPAHF